MNGALAYAKAGGIDRVFCGHTHVALHAERDGVSYYNTGSWIDARATYVTVGDEGVNIREHYEHAIELTIVIPAKNEARNLPHLLTSLSRQDYPLLPLTRVFVADAGSTDATVEIAIAVRRSPEHFRDPRRITVRRTQRGSTPRNHAVRAFH